MKIIDRIVGSFYHRMRKRKIVKSIVNGGGKLGRKVSLYVLRGGSFICGKRG